MALWLPWLARPSSRTWCPYCREPFEADPVLPAFCPKPRCAKPLVDENGQRVRAIDAAYGSVLRELEERKRTLLIYGLAASACLFLILPMLHVALTPAIMVPLLILATLVVVRLYLLAPCFRLLGSTRRAFLRWFTRLGFVSFGTFGYGLTIVPILGFFSGLATFTALTLATYHYAFWSLGREYRHQPLAWWEAVALGLLMVITLAVIVALVALVVMVGWTVGAVGDLFR